jgi:hypothetical protein
VATDAPNKSMTIQSSPLVVNQDKRIGDHGDRESVPGTFLCYLCHERFPVTAGEHGHIRRCPKCDGTIVVLLNEYQRPQPVIAPPEPAMTANSANAMRDARTTPASVPLTLYVVAAWFLAQGISSLAAATKQLATQNVLDVGDVLEGVFLSLVGWGLARLKRAARGFALLRCCFKLQ